MRYETHEFFNIRMKIPNEESFFFKMEDGNFLIPGT